MSCNRLIIWFCLLFCFQQTAYSQCGKVYVTSDDTVVCVPKIIKFKVHQFPAGTTFEWDFGSGYISADSTFTKLYTVAGNYQVKLKLTYPNGSNCFLTAKNIVQAKPIPKPQFSLDKQVKCKANDSFLLKDLTNKTVYRDWLIQNQLYSNAANAMYVKFAVPQGYKAITLFMKDSFGCEGKATFDSAVYVSDSMAVNFTVNKTSGCIPQTLQFTNLTDSTQFQIAQWKWMFPGATPNQKIACHANGIQYNSSDSFNVSLIATTLQGCQFVHQKKQYLQFADTLPLSIALNQNSICGNQSLLLQVKNVRSKGVKCVWQPNQVLSQSLGPASFKVKFNQIGAYQLVLTDSFNGCISTKNYAPLLTVTGPLARVQIPIKWSCLAADTFALLDSSKMAAPNAYTCQWNVFKSSAPNLSIFNSNQNNAVFLSNQLGQYDVRLICKGNNGCSDTVWQKQAISSQAIQPTFTWQPLTPCKGETIQFANQTKAGSPKAPNRYQWTFYDHNNTVIKRDTNAQANVVLNDTGFHAVKLLAYNAIACKDSITIPKAIWVGSPTPKFKVYDSLVCTKQLVRMRVQYKDSQYYKTFNHHWVFKHRDSSFIQYAFTGDSITAALLPGAYSVQYSRSSNRGTCYDTFTVNTLIKVSGVQVAAAFSALKGCNPFSSQASARLTFNYNFKNNNGLGVNYLYKNPYDTNWVVNRNPTLNPSTYRLKKSGAFDFSVVYAHASTCKDSIGLPRVIAGVYADFQPGNYACVNKALALVNRSDKAAIAYKWFLKDSISVAQFLPNDTAQQAKIVFKRPGVFKVGLIAFGNGACTDTVFQTLYVNQISAQFNSPDTLSYCAPVIARISAIKHPAILQYKWLINQKDTLADNLNNFAYLMTKNTGPIGFDVRLVVQAYGCNDTVLKKNYLRIMGPIPKFDVSIKQGCEPLQVRFNNQSLYYKKFFMEYGDGSVLDSVNLKQHAYKVFDRALPKVTYVPVLSILDSTGCFAQFIGDTIHVLRGPQSKFTVNNDTGCSNLQVTFRNNSVGAVKSEWDYEGDQTIDYVGFSNKHTYAAGSYAPMLITTASNACSDTLKQSVKIRSYEHPLIDFTQTGDSICYQTTLQFFAQSKGLSTVKKWLWDFGQNYSYTDTSTQANPKYTFTQSLNSVVTLLAFDQNNCSDTAQHLVHVHDTAGIPSKPIHYVSVDNNNNIRVQWAQNQMRYFKAYQLMRDNSGQYGLVYSSQLRNDTQTTLLKSTGINVNASRYCYVMKTKDVCNKLGSPAYPHCTILLNINNDSSNLLELNWLPYDGWGLNNVARYRIYRSVNASSFQLIDSVSGNSTQYKNDLLCPNSYCYYVQAVQRNGRFTSNSNQVCKSPAYTAPSKLVELLRTTVLPNGSTYTQWLPYKTVKQVNHYVVSKTYPSGSTNSYYAQVDSQGFIDVKSVDTKNNSYQYSVRAVDHCGAESPSALPHNTILLKGKAQDYTAQLNWNQYLKWYSGVKQYEVQVRRTDSFKTIAYLPKNQNTLTYDFSKENLEDSVCFLVKAIKDSSTYLESVSNCFCVLANAKITVPNVFTPNKDGHNEVFLPKAIFIFNQPGHPVKSYHLTIFNRWGEQVFASDDLGIGWDGYYKGQLCPDGHYVYRIQALALDGVTTFDIHGVFSLLR